MRENSEVLGAVAVNDTSPDVRLPFRPVIWGDGVVMAPLPFAVRYSRAAALAKRFADGVNVLSGSMPLAAELARISANEACAPAIESSPPSPRMNEARAEEDQLARQPVRVMIVELEAMFREGLQALFESHPDFQMVGCAPTAEAAIEAVHKSCPDILIVDGELPQEALDKLLSHVSRQFPNIRMILLGRNVSQDQLISGLRCGIRGVASKTDPANLLMDCVRTVQNGGSCLCNKSFETLVQVACNLPAANGPEAFRKKFGLTEREGQIAQAVMDGLPNAVIAQSLQLSEQTVKHHVSNVLHKTGAKNRVMLALMTTRNLGMCLAASAMTCGAQLLDGLNAMNVC